LGCLTHLKAVQTVGFWGLGKRVSCAKTGGPIFTIYTSYDVFLRKELPFGGRDDCTCFKIFSGVNNCLMEVVTWPFSLQKRRIHTLWPAGLSATECSPVSIDNRLQDSASHE